MKRKEHIDNLIKEGFTLNTLIKFTDKQLKNLSDRILQEGIKGNVIMNKKTSDSNDIKKVTDTGINVELKEKVNLKKKNIPKNIKMKPGVADTEKDLDEWVENIAEKEYHPFTSKNEILETIKVKLDEFKTSHETGKNVKSGHNGIPEWFTYDAIKSSTNPTIAPPKTKPGVAPKRQNPLKPGVGPNPKPKAGIENTNPTIAPPKTKPDIKPHRKNPLKPGVGPNTKPKAIKENVGAYQDYSNITNNETQKIKDIIMSTYDGPVTDYIVMDRALILAWQNQYSLKSILEALYEALEYLKTEDNYLPSSEY